MTVPGCHWPDIYKKLFFLLSETVSDPGEELIAVLLLPALLTALN